MKWYEVVEDLGDGSSATRRFETYSEAERYEERNDQYCYSGISEVDTESDWFYHKVYDEEMS